MCVTPAPGVMAVVTGDSRGLLAGQPIPNCKAVGYEALQIPGHDRSRSEDPYRKRTCRVGAVQGWRLEQDLIKDRSRRR